MSQLCPHAVCRRIHCVIGIILRYADPAWTTHPTRHLLQGATKKASHFKSATPEVVFSRVIMVAASESEGAVGDNLEGGTETEVGEKASA